MNFGSQDEMWKPNEKNFENYLSIYPQSMEVYKFYLTISHLKPGKLILKNPLAS